MAKIINILSSNNDYTPNEYIKQNALIKQRGLPLVAIPTTAGTGSEATHFSVIYVGKKKYSLSSEFMLPDYAIIDPMLCYKLPKKLLASSGIDALCQAVESYWAVRSTTESKKYAEEAIKLILPSIENAVDGDNDAIRNMSIAAHLSGKAINITTTTAPHALSYPMTAYYGVKHGHAVSLTLGSFFEINYKFNDSDLKDYRGKQYLLDTMEQIFDMFGAGNYMECKKYWKNLMFKIGLETDFKKIGIKSLHDKEIIAKNINIERLRNNPVNIDESIVQKILHGDL